MEEIEVFVGVVEARSFSGAAKRLDMPTTTVSSKIARLETRLGTSLIRRTTRQMEVTPEGQIYYRRCVNALAELTAGENELAETKQEPTGILRITAPVDLAQTVLPRIIKTYLDLYPAMSVDLRVTNDTVDLIRHGIDVAVRVGVKKDATLIARKFLDLTMALWASQDYIERMGTPLHPANLEKHQMIGLKATSSKIELVGNGENRFLLDLQGRLMTDDLQTARALTLQGAGIGLLPDLPGAYHNFHKELVPVLPDFHAEPVQASLVYPAQHSLPLKVRTFINLATTKDMAVAATGMLSRKKNKQHECGSEQ